MCIHIYIYTYIFSFHLDVLNPFVLSIYWLIDWSQWFDWLIERASQAARRTSRNMMVLHWLVIMAPARWYYSTFYTQLSDRSIDLLLIYIYIYMFYGPLIDRFCLDRLTEKAVVTMFNWSEWSIDWMVSPQADYSINMNVVRPSMIKTARWKAYIYI